MPVNKDTPISTESASKVEKLAPTPESGAQAAGKSISDAASRTSNPEAQNIAAAGIDVAASIAAKKKANDEHIAKVLSMMKKLSPAEVANKKAAEDKAGAQRDDDALQRAWAANG